MLASTLWGVSGKFPCRLGGGRRCEFKNGARESGRRLLADGSAYAGSPRPLPLTQARRHMEMLVAV
jgi:hypothetical protein